MVFAMAPMCRAFRSLAAAKHLTSTLTPTRARDGALLMRGCARFPNTNVLF